MNSKLNGILMIGMMGIQGLLVAPEVMATTYEAAANSAATSSSNRFAKPVPATCPPAAGTLALGSNGNCTQPVCPSTATYTSAYFSPIGGCYNPTPACPSGTTPSQSNGTCMKNGKAMPLSNYCPQFALWVSGNLYCQVSRNLGCVVGNTLGCTVVNGTFTEPAIIGCTVGTLVNASSYTGANAPPASATTMVSGVSKTCLLPSNAMAAP